MDPPRTSVHCAHHRPLVGDGIIMLTTQHKIVEAGRAGGINCSVQHKVGRCGGTPAVGMRSYIAHLVLHTFTLCRIPPVTHATRFGHPSRLQRTFHKRRLPVLTMTARTAMAPTHTLPTHMDEAIVEGDAAAVCKARTRFHRIARRLPTSPSQLIASIHPSDDEMPILLTEALLRSDPLSTP